MRRLGDLAERPLGERERRPAFWASAALLVAVAALLVALPDSGPPVESGPATSTGIEPPVSTLSVSTRPVADSAAEHAARRFLAGYLPYLYGRGPARSLAAAAPSLLVDLSRARFRVPPAARRRRPRLVRLEERRLAERSAAVTAQVEDGGPADYPVVLELARREGRWLVVETGGD